MATVPDEMVVMLREAMGVFDKNQAGTLDRKKLGEVMDAMDPREDGQSTLGALQDMLLDVDKDGSGTIDFNEFLELVAQKMAVSDPKEEVRQAYKLFDIDGDGFIDPAELMHKLRIVVPDITTEEIEEALKQLDTDGDGKLCVDEFTDLVSGPPL